MTRPARDEIKRVCDNCFYWGRAFISIDNLQTGQDSSPCRRWPERWTHADDSCNQFVRSPEGRPQ